jgi:hypothetical protein
MYTLNYDRNFKILMERSKYNYSVFEGFECKDTVDYNDKLRPNIRRILADYDSHVHYNLHGSIFWRVKARNQYQLELPEFFLACGAHLEVNTNEYATFQSERGKTILLTNFVTGYQKTQKAVFSPFKQMQAAFDKDCYFADQLIIVGYSFGDEHINSTIRTALSDNDKLQIVIVDPAFTLADFDLTVMLRIFAASKDMNAGLPKTLKKNEHSFLGGRVIVHTKKFKEYMEDSLRSNY